MRRQISGRLAENDLKEILAKECHYYFVFSFTLSWTASPGKHNYITRLYIPFKWYDISTFNLPTTASFIGFLPGAEIYFRQKNYLIVLVGKGYYCEVLGTTATLRQLFVTIHKFSPNIGNFVNYSASHFASNHDYVRVLGVKNRRVLFRFTDLDTYKWSHQETGWKDWRTVQLGAERGVDSLSKKDGKKLLSVSQVRNNTIIDCFWFRTDVEVETRMLWKIFAVQQWDYELSLLLLRDSRYANEYNDI